MAKILYIWKSPFPWDVRVEKICTALAKNHEVQVLAKWNGEDKKTEVYNGFTIQRIGFRRDEKFLKPLEWNPIWKKGIKQQISEFKPDIVIQREIFLSSIIVSLKNKYRFKLIADIAEHYPFLIDYWEHYNPLLKFLASRFRYYYKLEEKLVRAADHVWTVVSEQSGRLRKYNGQIDEIYNSTLSQSIDRTDSSKVCFAYHGYINKERDLELFLKVFDRFSKSCEDCILDIYGNGPTYDSLKLYSESLSNPAIEVKGAYDHSQLNNLLSNCDVGVIPYPDNEHINHTLSNKFFDYGLNNITILASDNPPMARLISEYSLGYNYRTGDEQSLFESIQKSYNFIKEGSSRDNSEFINSEFTWDSQEEKMERIIHKVLS